jgi:hypothetical protein
LNPAVKASSANLFIFPLTAGRANHSFPHAAHFSENPFPDDECDDQAKNWLDESGKLQY